MILSNSKEEIEASILARARLKRLKGELLSPLDTHLLTLCKQKSYSIPSILRAIFKFLASLTKLSVLCFCLLFLYGKYLEKEESILDEGSPTDSLSVEEYSNPVSESSILAFNPEYNSEINIVSEEGSKVDPHYGLVQFITGVIAVYLPETQDSSKVAKNIVSISQEEEIDPLFIASIISVESRFSTKAKSGVGASGLMQLMPRTAKMLAAKFSDIPETPKLTDTRINISLGIRYIKELLESYKGNKRLALAAYNMGPTKLNKILSSKGRIPGSVERYASSIIKKSTHWRRHFEGVSE